MIKLVACWCPHPQKKPKRSKRIKQQPTTPTIIYTQESHKYTKLEHIIYVHRTCFRPIQVLSILLQSLELIRDFIIVDLKGLVFLLSSIPSGSYTLFFFYTSTWFSDPQDVTLDGDNLFLTESSKSLILYIMSGYGSLNLFPSALRENFSDDDWTRHWWV